MVNDDGASRGSSTLIFDIWPWISTPGDELASPLSDLLTIYGRWAGLNPDYTTCDA